MNVILLDTNIASYPIYDALIKFGHNVFVAGNNDQDFLAKVCVPGNYIKLDYSDYQSVIKAKYRHNIHLLIPGSNDVSFMSVAKVNQYLENKLNIDTPELIEIINSKDLFKIQADLTGIPVPKSFTENEIFSNGIREFLIKPTNSYSGQGIKKISTESDNEIHLEIKKAKDKYGENNIIYEEYITGQLYSHSCFIDDQGEILREFIVEENCIVSPYSVDFSYLVDYSELPFKGELVSLKKNLKNLAVNLKLKSGLIHTQFIHSPISGLKVLEMTRRCPGDLYSLLIQKSTSFNYSQMYAFNFFMKSFNPKLTFKENKSVIRQTIKVPSEKFFLSTNISNNLKFRDIEYFIHEKSGFANMKNEPVRAGILFYELYSFQDILAAKSQAINGSLTKIKSTNE